MPVEDLLPLGKSEKEKIRKMVEPKGVKVWVSVQLKTKVVQLNLGRYTLGMIFNTLINRESTCYTGNPVASVLILALGYTGEVENELRVASGFGEQAFRDRLWVWLAGRLEEVSSV